MTLEETNPIHLDWEKGYYANVLWKLFDMGRRHQAHTECNEHKRAKEVYDFVDNEIYQIVTQVDEEEGD
jgi:hypothetical protein